ncbi:glycosyltransferase family 1 protein [Algoriphagus aestuariicola]|uniref:Glycosyltransferase family 1 protein n=1 Tax=Algoriphagus aestuariicola TaxID=1852016 RepID=A0ABS3BRD1_9BACT|nr:glycosyltransferase [Algoriphagus aestuariicola]MBN7800826.1 glycosyltransferase family 1 protein [Algoriphagus aestuariicola]
MKVLLISIGTRGDIEPFLAQAELLQKAGHEVVCLFPEQFRETVEKMGLDFLGFDRRFLEMLDSSVGKSVMGGGGNTFTTIKNFYRLMKTSLGLQKILIEQQKDAIDSTRPDRVIFHPKALYCTLPAMAEPKKFFQLSPIPNLIHPHPNYQHLSLSKWKPFSSKWNLRSYGLVNGTRYIAFNKFVKPYFKDFQGIEFSTKSIKNFELKRLQVLYQISPALYPKPSNWPECAYLTGFFARNQNQHYQPDPALTAWLEKYPKAILLTFGSMTNPKPLELSSQIIGLLEKHQIPAIVNLSWGGLQKVESSGESIYYVNQIPYDWILPKLHGIVHHGGSGTTHFAARSAAVQLIVPHIMDQYFWNRLINNNGLGPLGTSIHNFNLEKFEEALIDFWNNPEYRANAALIAEKMSHESDPQELIHLITR